jgi:hypothetical protein
MAYRASVNLTQQDRDYIGRVVNTEVDHRLAKSNPAEYQRQIEGVVNTILNREVSPQFNYDSVADVANAPRQFSKINGPKKTSPYGSVENTPQAPAAVQRVVDSYVGDLMAGNPEAFAAGSTHYLNPTYSDQSNLNAWGNAVVAQGNVAGIGKGRQYYGNAPGFDPAYADATGDLANFQDVSRQQVGIGLGMKGPLAADAIDRANERGAAISDRVSPSLATPSERMWGAVQSVLGAPVTAAMRAGQIGVDIGIGLADQAARIAQNSAQQQPNNPAADSPANRMRSAVGLPAHPSTPTPGQTAPIGQVSRGPDLAAPADRMHAAIQSQYGGPTAAADAAHAQGINYSPSQVQTKLNDANSLYGNTPAPGTVGVGKPGELGTTARTQPAHPATPTPQAPAVTTPLGMNTAPSTDIGDFSLSANGDIAPSAGLSPQARMDENNLNAQIAAASVGPAPGAVTGKKPGELGYTPPAPVAPPVAAPVAPPPQPRPVAVAPAKPRTIQSVQPALPPAPAPPAGLQTAVAKARPGTSLFDAISQNNLGAAPDGTRWGVGLTGKPVAVPTSAPEGVQIAASGTGLLGASG